MHGVCILYRGYLAHGNSKGEARGRSGHKNNVSSKKCGRKEREHEGKSPKHDLTSANY